MPLRVSSNALTLADSQHGQKPATLNTKLGQFVVYILTRMLRLRYLFVFERLLHWHEVFQLSSHIFRTMRAKKFTAKGCMPFSTWAQLPQYIERLHTIEVFLFNCHSNTYLVHKKSRVICPAAQFTVLIKMRYMLDIPLCTFRLRVFIPLVWILCHLCGKRGGIMPPFVNQLLFTCCILMLLNFLCSQTHFGDCKQKALPDMIMLLGCRFQHCRDCHVDLWNSSLRRWKFG